MGDWDEVIGSAASEAARSITNASGEGEPGELRHLQPALVAALKARLADRVSVGAKVSELPDSKPPPGGVDVLIANEHGASPVVGVELKSDKLDQTIWDIFKMASLRRMPGVEAAYVIAAAKRAKFHGASAGAPLFDTSPDDGEEWAAIYFFTEWRQAWADLLAGGSGRPTRVLRMLFLRVVCACEITAFPGWEARAMRVENTNHGWLVLDSWPSHLDPNPYRGELRQVSDSDLTCADLPAPDADENAYHRFALTTDGYAREGNLANCARIANEAKEHWRETGEVPRTLRHLRTCLFFEQRRAHMSGYDFSADTFVYVRAIVERMREILC